VEDDPLGISITKWEFIIHAITLWGKDIFPLQDGGAATCGLCRAYSSFCRDCPTECSSDSSPYKRYCRATSWEEALEAAKDEVGHLKSLGGKMINLQEIKLGVEENYD